MRITGKRLKHIISEELARIRVESFGGDELGNHAALDIPEFAEDPDALASIEEEVGLFLDKITSKLEFDHGIHPDDVPLVIDYLVKSWLAN